MFVKGDRMEDYKREIKRMLDLLEEKDIRIVKTIYTLLLRHIRKGRR